MSIIPILLLADCEPDLRTPPKSEPAPWLGFERFHDFMTGERDRLAQRSGHDIRINWFWRLDPQIEAIYGAANWPLRRYAAQLADMRSRGDGIGLHVHAWRWDEPTTCWIADHGNMRWVEHCLRQAFATYRSNLGRDCTIFRFGDGWFDSAIVPFLEDLGARIDLTLEPGIAARPGLVAGEATTGSIPDRRGVPQRPYHPARADFCRPASEEETRLWLLPVSTNMLVKRPKLSHPLRLLRWARSPKRQRQQLNIEILPKRFPQVFARALAESGMAYAALCVRSDIGTSEARLAMARQNLGAILDHPLAARFRFVTPEQALAALAPRASAAIS